MRKRLERPAAYWPQLTSTKGGPITLTLNYRSNSTLRSKPTAIYTAKHRGNSC
jgi:hypothetical protein